MHEPVAKIIRIDACIHIDVHTAPVGVVIHMRNGDDGAHGSYSTCLHLSPERAEDLAVALLDAAATCREDVP